LVWQASVEGETFDLSNIFEADPVNRLWWLERDGEDSQEATVRINPHAGQSEAWRSKARFVVVLAGTQAGKTTFGPVWLHREIYGTDNYEGKGRGDYLAVTSNFGLFSLKMLPEMVAFFCVALGVGRYWGTTKVIELREHEGADFWAKKASDPMWGRIILRSAISKSGLEASSAKAVWMDEAGQDEFTLSSWESIRSRVSIGKGRILITTTLYNHGYLKTQIYDRWEEGDEDFEVIQFPSYLNPSFPKDEYDEREATMQPWRFLMRYAGKYTKMPNLIFSSFEESMVVDDFVTPPPPDWRRVVGLDFGPVNNVRLYFAHNPIDNRWYLYNEIHEGHRTTRTMCSEVKEVENREMIARNVSYIGGGPSEGQIRDDWGDLGVDVLEPDIRFVEPQLDRAVSLVTADSFRVCKKCEGFRDEIGKFKRKTDENGNPLDEILNEKRFHHMAAFRYGAVLMDIRKKRRTGKKGSNVVLKSDIDWSGLDGD
jgi:hypothetical protein